MGRLNHAASLDPYEAFFDRHEKAITPFVCHDQPQLELNNLSLIHFNSLPINLGKEAANLLIWNDWNIIFSYTTYFSEAIKADHLQQLAVDIVQTGLAVISHYSEGFLAWKSAEVHVELFDIGREPFVQATSAEITLPEGLNPYQSQCALHVAQQRFFYHHHLSPMADRDMRYFSAFLDPCELTVQGTVLRLYPSVTVHQNGVFQMHFRVLSNGDRISTRELIDRFLNSPMFAADDILLPPMLMHLDARKILFEDELYSSRTAHLRQWNELQKGTDHPEIRVLGGADSFDHDLVSMIPEGKGSQVRISLGTLTDMLGNALVTLLNQPRTGWKYRLLGPRRAKYVQGNFWRGRPTVYLLSMRDQPATASEIHKMYATDLGHIMLRSKDVPVSSKERQLGDSLRSADDYLTYTGSAANLFVYSRSGLNAHAGADPNGNELIYRLQSQVDFVDFINGSLWQCEERALIHARTVEELIANRERQTIYDYASRYPFHYGELNDWFAAVQKAENMDATRASIAFNTTLNLEKFKERRNFKRQQFQWLMAALLGVIAAGTSGGKLVSVIWEGMGGTARSEFQYALMAMGTVTILFAVLYKIFIEPLRSS